MVLVFRLSAQLLTRLQLEHCRRVISTIDWYRKGVYAVLNNQCFHSRWLHCVSLVCHVVGSVL